MEHYLERDSSSSTLNNFVQNQNTNHLSDGNNDLWRIENESKILRLIPPITTTQEQIELLNQPGSHNKSYGGSSNGGYSVK